MAITAITNIGKIISGDINQPIIEGRTIIVEDDLIKEISSSDINSDVSVDHIIDVQGATIAPGLIDSHTHPVLGDYTPRQDSSNYLEGFVHGGVTSIISAGEVHTPGRPKDPDGVKALALLTQKAFYNFRPKGLNIHAGALILEKGLKEEDFKELADKGIWLVGEIGLGSVRESQDAALMSGWAKAYGMKVHMHTGGLSIPGSSVVTADMVMDVSPTLSSHTNGGPTAIPLHDIDRLIEETNMPLEIVQCGNIRVADHIVKKLDEKKQLSRLIIGTDTPSGSGVLPLGMMRTITQLSSLANIPAEKIMACATGNTAELFDLNTSFIAPNKKADLIVMDSPIGSSGEDAIEAIECGDIPAITMVMIDGEIRIQKSRNTPPGERQPIFNLESTRISL